MKTKQLCTSFMIWCLLIGSQIVFGQSQKIDFEGKSWDGSSANVEVVQHMGRSALLVRSGTVLLEDVEFQDGTIEVNIAPSSNFAFAGLVFRAQSADDLEEVYLRLHKSGLPDALQYTPRYNAMAAWQFYNGEGYTAATVFPTDKWINLRVEITGKKADIYVGDSDEPVLSSMMIRDVEAGKIGLWGLVGARFSNFRFTPAASDEMVMEEKGNAPAGFIEDWEISQVFSAESVDSEKYPSSNMQNFFLWNTLPSDATGLVNISKIKHINEAEGEGDVMVYARTSIDSNRNQVKKLSFGYSDEVSIYLNGKLLFTGNSRWRSRDIGFNGIIGLHDHVCLDLKKGENELLFVVTEWFGGWGHMAKLE